MNLVLLSLVVLAAGGLGALVAGRSARTCTFLGAGGAVAASAIGLLPSFVVLGSGSALRLSLAWDVPYGSFALEVDALSAFFLVPIFLLTALAALFGSEYLQPQAGHRSLGPAWFFYNLLTAAMVLVVCARNGVLFLVGWEVMALASFFLVTLDDEKESVRQAGWTYLVAMHLGTAFLLALFVLLGRQGGGSLDFSDFAAPDSLPASLASVLFLLALVGFGTKAGFLPLHVWLPEAHPAAPSHVSAVMSGVMIKTGIYGLVRVLTFLGPPPAWWAWLLIAIGLSSGVLGVLLALAQHDLKRLLAYHSVENIGIITLGLGVGLLGLSAGVPALAALGFAGGLLHVVNHALFKGLLFLGAGAVRHATGTLELDELGGLLKRLPWTAAAFLTGAVAISGLPPLNGFVSEFLIYWAAFEEQMTLGTLAALPPLVVIAGLALIGGLAAACFVKAFGIVFLGEPRSAHARHAHPTGRLMRWPMLVLAAGCLLVAVLAPFIVPALAPVVATATRLPAEAVTPSLTAAAEPLSLIVTISGVLLALIAGLACLRRALLRQQVVTEAETWACGYAHPTVRMQYTASSFAQPFTELFQPVLRTQKPRLVLTEYFPAETALATQTPEPWRESFYRPLFLAVGRGLAKLRWLQHGRVHLYVLYIAFTILILLVWYLGWAL